MAPRTTKQGIQHYVERFRNFSDWQGPYAGSEDEDPAKWRKLPAEPSELWLSNAGGTVRTVLRLGGFKDDAGVLTSTWRTAGNKGLWKEVVTNLRARANLPYTFDYLKTFDEDCQLVADALDAECGDTSPAEPPESMKHTWDDRDTEFISNSDAIVDYASSMTLSTLSKTLTPSGPIRYMRNGQRCKVHIGDFRAYVGGLSNVDLEALADEVFAQREATKDAMQKEKDRTGK